MPACIKLYNKATGEADTFQHIDDRICRELLHVEPDPVKWVESWYDCICVFLALGKDYDYVRDVYHDMPTMLNIIGWLEVNYTPDAWYEVGKR